MKQPAINIQGDELRIMLSKKQLEFFRKLLNQQLEDLLSGVTKTVSDMSDDNENMPDPSDRASLESDRNFTLRIRDRERKLIGKIKDALERIEDGTYGICESCEEDISEGRLKARPVTTLCIECKKKQEVEEKLKGR